MTSAVPAPSGTTGEAGSALPSPTPSSHSAVITAAQEALAAELQAVWGYPVLGPRLVDLAQVAQARAADDAHRHLALVIEELIAGLGALPVQARPSYPLPSSVADAVEAVAYAVSLEQDCAAALRFVVLRTSGGDDVAGLKALAVDALVATAVRATGWRAVTTPDAATVAFPGT